jgi:site-specific DNA recombinase
MNVVLWARVSSREQREGYSIDAQLRAMREKAQREGFAIVREFEVAESARRGAERLAFNDMIKWVRSNAKRNKIKAILSHKLDRVCRNMRDAVRLQELEDACGVQLAFVENQFGPGAAGLLSFNVMAAVAQYYSDNLRSEVLKGMDEKVRQGWPTGLAPFGYVNVQDCSEEPVQPHPEKAKTVVRIFELYARGDMTFRSLADALQREGHTYRPSQPRFTRTALSYILNNRFYIGELCRKGHVHEGRYRKLISRGLFDACQDVLNGRNRRTGSPQLALSGGLLRCAHCGFAITGERIRRRLRGGVVNEHVYYRCANNHPESSHPKVRWRADDLEEAIARDLSGLRIECPEVRGLVRRTLDEAFTDAVQYQRRQAAALARRRSELAAMHDRLLSAFLTGAVDEATFGVKSGELKHQMAGVSESQERLGQLDERVRDRAIAVFDWCQNVADNWRRSNSAVRRQILDSVSLNRTLSATNLCISKRKPFDLLAEGLDSEQSRGDRI